MTSKDPYEFRLVPTTLDSDDEDSSSEEDTVFVSSVLDHRRRRKRRSFPCGLQTKLSNKLFALLVLTVLLLITILIMSYVVHSINNGSVSSSAVSGNQTATKGENPSPSSPPSASSDENQLSTDIVVTSGLDNGYHTPYFKSWQLDIVASTEMSIVVHDINNDGTPDLIFDALTEKLEHNKYIVCPNKKDSCTEDTGHSPCRIQLVALDSGNGKTVWEKWISFAPFAGNCKHDLNQDGAPDCTFSGRQGSFVAINPVDDSLLWYADPAITFPTYNYYYPLFIRDFDKDGVIDIVTTHGGDAVYGDGVKNRSPAFIFIISGRTGQQISERIPMPDGHETYMSPIAFNISGSIEVVLFGSGGETISGSLWAITVESLQKNVDAWAPNKPEKYDVHKTHFDTRCLSDKEVARTRPKFKPGTFKHVEEKEDWLSRCPVWNEDTQPLWNPYKVCVYEIVAAGITGTIVPPVIIDYNGDSVKDLLVSQFNDHVMMIDGATMKQQWDHYAEDTQSYSVPSPLYFNNDDTPDFLFRFNKGKWMTYDYSYMGVLDGANGELLWSLHCSVGGAMTSPVTIKSSIKGHDGVLFLAAGCKMVETSTSDPSSKQDNTRSKRESMCPDSMNQHDCDRLADSKRHDGENEDVGDQGDGVTEDELIGLWEVAGNDEDVFPNPWTDTRSFIEDYCHLSYDLLTADVYYLTPKMIESGHIKPIYSYEPYVYKFPSELFPNSTNQPVSDHPKHNRRKSIRCSQVLAPSVMVSTPLISDFNKDSRLDGVITMVYTSQNNKLNVFDSEKVKYEVFTIEERLVKVQGPAILETVNFDSYYPIDKQPWRSYMGSGGDGVY